VVLGNARFFQKQEQQEKILLCRNKGFPQGTDALNLLFSRISVAKKWCSTLPPSVLPDISPTRREISSCEVGNWLISAPVGEMSGRTEGAT
jgi:hypothetical protein